MEAWVVLFEVIREGLWDLLYKPVNQSGLFADRFDVDRCREFPCEALGEAVLELENDVWALVVHLIGLCDEGNRFCDPDSGIFDAWHIDG